MPTLSSLLLEREVTTLREMDVALARQLAHGGDLVTNLLEVAPVDERALVAVMADAAKLRQMPSGQIPEPDPAALKMMPADLAQRLQVMPISVDEDILMLAVAEPLSSSVEEELTFALARAIEQRITTPLRIREAHARWYGLSLDRRLLRLLARLEGRPDPSPSVAPPRREPGDSSRPPRLPRRSSAPAGTFESVSVAPIISIDTDTHADASEYARERGPTTKREHPPPMPPAEVPTAEPVRTRSSGPASERALMRPAQDAPMRRPGMGRRRGPFTAAMAQEALSGATTHGVMLRVLFDFARQYFEYTALFVLHGDLAEGVDAAGPGAGPARIRGVGVPIEIPSILSTARDRRSALLTRPSEEGIDAFLRQDLQRPMTAQVLVVPVVVRNRVVALLYGDDGDAAVAMNEVGDVLALASLVGRALEQLLLQRKRSNQPPKVGEPRAARDRRGTAPAIKAQAPTAADRHVIAPFPVAAPFPEREASTLPGMQTGPRHITATYLNAVKPSELATKAREQESVPATPPDAPAEVTISPAAQSVRSRDFRPPGTSRPTPLGFSAPQPFSSSIESVRVARVISVGPESPPVPIFGPPVPGPPPVPRTPTSPAPGFASTRGATPAPKPAESTREEELRGPATLESGRPPSSSGQALSPKAASVPPRLELSPDQPRLELVAELEEVTGLEEAPDVLVGESDEPDEMLETVLAELERSSPEIGTVAGDEALMRETAVAHTFVEEGPREPPKSQPPGDRNLPLVIVDLEGEAEELLNRLMHATDGRVASEARAELLRMGAAAARTVARHFPGPVHQSIDFDLPDLPAASECGPVLDVAVALGQASVLGHAMVQELVKLTERSEPATRVWAMLALADVGTDRTVDPVLQGLMGEDARVRRGARWAAIALSGSHAAGRAMREAIEQIADNATMKAPTRVYALETIGEMRDPSSVPMLIRALGDNDSAVSEAALRALRAVTRKDLPASVKKWGAWWEENQTRPRIEWLIDALTSTTPDLREASAKELAERTGRDFGYRSDMPAEARASVQARYRALRAQEGRDPREP
ncbi:MAG: HEAT repeat domain-containing protein [Deltaproteobacteria bacterium]|nr:HEAT repeat domain-containing protein [Deltaproteobacteria bacterium]